MRGNQVKEKSTCLKVRLAYSFDINPGISFPDLSTYVFLAVESGRKIPPDSTTENTPEHKYKEIWSQTWTLSLVIMDGDSLHEWRIGWGCNSSFHYRQRDRVK